MTKKPPKAKREAKSSKKSIFKYVNSKRKAKRGEEHELGAYSK